VPAVSAQDTANGAQVMRERAPATPAVAERLWLAQQEPGPEWDLLAFAPPAAGALADSLWASLGAQALRLNSPAAEALQKLLPPGGSPQLFPLETPSGPLIAVVVAWLAHSGAEDSEELSDAGHAPASNTGAAPEQRIAALLAWLREPRTWAAPEEQRGARFDRLPAEAALLALTEGPEPLLDTSIPAEQLARVFQAEPRFVALLAPAEKALESEASVGVRRLDGSLWQMGSRSGREQARKLSALLGNYARLESLELEYRFTPSGRAPMALRQVRRFASLSAEVFSGAAETRADTPMLVIEGPSAYREQQGRRLPLEGAALSEALAGEQRTWPRLLQALAAQSEVCLEPQDGEGWLICTNQGGVAQLFLDPDGWPRQLVQVPGQRSTTFEDWSPGGQGLYWPTAFMTDSGRFELLAAQATLLTSDAPQGPDVATPPAPPAHYGDSGAD
jgi:hypothetical protein